MKSMYTEEYISPEIGVLNIEIETAICVLSNEQLDYDDDAFVL